MSECGNGCTSCESCRESQRATQPIIGACTSCRATPYATQPIVGARDVGEVAARMPDIARQAEGIFNSIWQQAAPIVPYGTQIDAGVQGIRRAAGLADGASAVPIAMIREAQSVTRRVRKGDRAAKERYQQVKREGGARWRVYVAVARDDQRRIDSRSA